MGDPFAPDPNWDKAVRILGPDVYISEGDKGIEIGKYEIPKPIWGIEQHRTMTVYGRGATYEEAFSDMARQGYIDPGVPL